MECKKCIYRIFSCLLAALIVFMAMSFSLINAQSADIILYAGNTAEFAGGTGAEDDPYLISTKEHLNNVRNYLDAHFKVISNIEFTDEDFAEEGYFYNDGKAWIPIGSDQYVPFTGTFDGGYHTVKGLKVGNGKHILYAGLFGYNAGAVSNLNICCGDVNAVNSRNYVYSGVIAGYNAGIISDCRNTGNSVSATASFDHSEIYAGGITGYNVGIISDCHNTGNVSASSSNDSVVYVGGISGKNHNGTIRECCNTGTVSAVDSDLSSGPYNSPHAYAGGIVGGTNETISNCYNTGVVSAIAAADSKPSSSHAFAGGIAAGNGVEGTIVKDCYNTGSVSAISSSATSPEAIAGGIFGLNYYGTIGNCYNTGTVSATSTFTDSFICDMDFVGGIVGSNDGAVSNCYYLDSISSGCGFGEKAGMISCTEIELRLQQTFSEFDFESVWTMDGNADYPYPELKDNLMVFSVVLPGDVDEDGNITASDLALLWRLLLEGRENFASDVNNDGLTDIRDLIKLKKLLLL